MTLQMERALLTWKVTFLFLLYSSTSVEGLIGYDCNGATLNITTVSLIEIGDCHIPIQEVNETGVHIQLLQLNQYAMTHVYQCKIEIFRVIRRCGMWSHGMDVPNGEYSYIDTVSRDVCDDIYKYGKVKIGQTEIHGIKSNSTIMRPISIAGTVNQDASCEGVYYSDPYGNWDKVYVKGTVKITLRDYWTDVDVDANQVQLYSGMRCDLGKGRCVDIDGGNTYWNPFPEDSCHSKRYGVLYEGPAKRTTDMETRFKQTMYSLTEGDIIFALTAKDRVRVCGYTLIRTEHPKLLIVEIEKGEPFVKREPLSVNNLDLFAYVNSKFVYVEKYIRTQMKQMYIDILTQRCNLERQVLENTIGLAKQSPDEFAYNIMKGPGYMAALSGEVAHIVKCIPIEVKIRETKECYTQLPVEVGNNSYHLTPRTHILKKTGTQVTCNTLVPSMYRIDGDWYSLEPRPIRATVPTVLKPLTEHTWTYRNPQALATSGIYTQKDLDELREHIMFAAESPAILNSVARGIAGQPTITQGGTIANLIDEQAINKIIESSWDKSWGYFSTFGTFSAGLIGIVMICRGIKLIIDTVIHGYALHTVYGWSLYLIGAIWDSVTNLLLHLGKKLPKKDNGDDDSTNEPTRKSLLHSDPPSYYQEDQRAGRALFNMEPFHFGFDPRIHELQRTINSGGPGHHYQTPATIHTPETLPSYPTVTTLPRLTEKKNKYYTDDKERYKTPRPLPAPYNPMTGNHNEELKEENPPRPFLSELMTRLPEKSESVLQTQSDPDSHAQKPLELIPQASIAQNINEGACTSEEIYPPPQLDSYVSMKPNETNETESRIYPTLEKIKKTKVYTPCPERRQMYLSLERRPAK